MQIASMPTAAAALRPAPTPAELPVLVAYAKSVIEFAHAKAQSQASFMLVQARDYLEILPSIINRAVAIDGIDRGVFWALEGTRLLARGAHAKANALLEIPENPPTLRAERHKDLKAQMDLVLERIKSAEELLRKPWPRVS
jgi:hypothetical protein